MVGSQPAIAKEGDAPVTASALGEANLVHTMKTHQSTNPFALPLRARSARAGPPSRFMHGHSAVRLCATDRLWLRHASLRWSRTRTRGISRARSFDLEVTPWAPTRLTSYISHIGPEESSGASTLSQTAQARP